MNDGPQGAACDLQSTNDIAQTEGVNQDVIYKNTGTIPKRRNIGLGKVVIGAGATRKQLLETPVGRNSPKSHLAWSPETPLGRPRKYSIGEAGSPVLRKETAGVIQLDGRIAFPSLEGDMGDMIRGIEDLRMPDESDSRLELGGESPILKLKEVTTVKSSKKKRAKKLKLLPGQKLLTDMMVKEKAEDTLKNDGQ